MAYPIANEAQQADDQPHHRGSPGTRPRPHQQECLDVCWQTPSIRLTLLTHQHRCPQQDVSQRDEVTCLLPAHELHRPQGEVSALLARLRLEKVHPVRLRLATLVWRSPCLASVDVEELEPAHDQRSCCRVDCSTTQSETYPQEMTVPKRHFRLADADRVRSGWQSLERLPQPAAGRPVLKMDWLPQSPTAPRR